MKRQPLNPEEWTIVLHTMHEDRFNQAYDLLQSAGLELLVTAEHDYGLIQYLWVKKDRLSDATTFLGEE